jgi:diguanylate cyclase (GGDEF)-like protein/PAS domain S-box-containing protein
MGDNVLLVEDDPAEAQALLEALADPRSGPCTVEWVKRLDEGLQRLKSGGISVILLDVFLPDSQGIETFDKMLRVAPRVPILILSSLADEGVAQQACQRGAKDYFLKGNLGGYSLPLALHNVIVRNSSDKASFVEAERARVTLDSIGDAVLSTDVAGNVSYVNRVAESLTGWPREEAVGRPLAEVFKIIDGVTREPAPDPMQHAIQANATVGLTMNCVLIRRDGQESAIEDAAAPIHDSDGELTGAVIVFRDVNAARALALKMSHLAQHDSLTDLPNRSLLTQRLVQAIALAGRHNRQVGVLFLDLDHFKNVNDTLGHAIGDKLLQSVGKRLGSCVRRSDIVSRQGGDEFIVLLSEIGGETDAARCAKKLLTAVAATHPIEGNDINIGASIGISIFPENGQDAGALLKAADTAMYHAKEQGGIVTNGSIAT